MFHPKGGKRNDQIKDQVDFLQGSLSGYASLVASGCPRERFTKSSFVVNKSQSYEELFFAPHCPPSSPRKCPVRGLVHFPKCPVRGPASPRRSLPTDPLLVLEILCRGA